MIKFNKNPIKKSIKILIVAEISGPGSGTYSFLLRLLEIQKLNNIKTFVLLQKKFATPEVLLDIKNYNATIFISFFNRPRFFYKPIVSLFFDLLYALPFFIKCKPNLIHITHGTPGIFLGIFLFPVSILHTLHTVPLEKLRYKMPYFLHKILANKKKLLSTVSIYSQNAIVNYFGVKDKSVRVIYNSNQINIDSSETFENDSSNSKINILTLGHVVDYKNPQGWLTVATLIVTKRPQVTFIWAGEGDLRKYFMNIVKEKKLDDSIKFIGYQQKTAKLYKEATIYFQPSILENHSISVVDAMSYYLPCVVSDAGGLPESVINGVTGYVCPKSNIKAYTERLLELIDNPSIAKTMGAKGRERAIEMFSQRTQELKYLELYSELTGVSFNV